MDSFDLSCALELRCLELTCDVAFERHDDTDADAADEDEDEDEDGDEDEDEQGGASR